MAETWLKGFFCAATHRQAEHSGGLTSAVPVRQQILRRGKRFLLRIFALVERSVLRGKPKPSRCRPQIIQSLDEDPAAQNKQLTLRLQQIAAALENKVTDL